MKMPIETVRGTHYEMGVQHGKAYRHVIVGNIHQYAMRHDFQGSDEEIDQALEPVRLGEETFAPWVFEELKGIAEGSGVPFPWLVRMHLRVWNYVPKKERRSHGCTGIGMISKEEGVIVGGTLDDPRQCYSLLRRIPQEGIPHIQVIWVGSSWGHNGVNAEGLCIAQASVSACRPALSTDDSRPRIRTTTAGRILLEQCKNVSEALKRLKEIRSNDSFVIGDAAGNLVACQCLGGFDQAFEFPEDNHNFLFNTNHIHMPDLTAKVMAQGCVPGLSEYSTTRFTVLEKARISVPRTMETMQQLLRSHEGYPHSICNDGTVAAIYAMPQTRPGILYVADMPPCRNEFVEYSMEQSFEV